MVLFLSLRPGSQAAQPVGSASTAQRAEPVEGGGRWGAMGWLGPVGMETEVCRERRGAVPDRPGASRLGVGLLTSELHGADVPLPATRLISTSVCLLSGCQQRHGLLP